LHDTVEDTDVVTFERIENEFGPTVRRIVEGETKVQYCFFFKAATLIYFADYVVNLAQKTCSVFNIGI
jgi:(p)ppGpp synthase/HD superfamily hydrolase